MKIEFKNGSVIESIDTGSQVIRGQMIFAHPTCYEPNDDPYPLCKGDNTPQGLAENDCYRCCLYEDMKEDW
jgi:hypothetical protein